MRDSMKDQFLAVLTEPRTLQRGYFKPDAVRALIEEHASGRRNRSGLLWRMLVLELWHRNFLEREAGAKMLSPPAILATEVGRVRVAPGMTEPVARGAGLN
jgi:hypothetical protein